MNDNMNIPHDPFILLSYVNTQLRDQYPSLDEFCACQGIDAQELQQTLTGAGFEYSAEQNRFW